MTNLTSLVVRVLAALVALASCALIPGSAHAGGLFLFDRGARPLSRGGAFVAGADDPNSLWYNPAGLIDSKNQVLLDATLSLMVNTSFTRVNVDSEGGEYRHPTVKPKPTPIPIPAGAVSHDFGLKSFVFGFGATAPNAVVINWPQSVSTPYGNQPAPTRYSVMGIKGTIIANIAAGVAWQPIKGLSIGADVQMVLSQFRIKTALSACDKFVCSFAEDPDFDAIADVKLPAVAVTGMFGLIYDMKLLRVGAAVSLPYELKGTANLDIDLPKASIFNEARLAGSTKADMGIKFPLIVRVGGELRPIKAIRMEGNFVLEKWSTQDEITIKPNGLQITDVTGIGTYDVGPVTVPRKMRDTWSLRGGMEIAVPRRWSPWGAKWALRGGIAYEKGAFGSSAMTPLTLDSDKFILAGGFGVNLHKRLRFDTVLGYMFMKDQKVRDSEIRQPQAIRPMKEEYGNPIGNGDYKMDALFLGGGFAIDIN